MNALSAHQQKPARLPHQICATAGLGLQGPTHHACESDEEQNEGNMACYDGRALVWFRGWRDGMQVQVWEEAGAGEAGAALGMETGKDGQGNSPHSLEPSDSLHRSRQRWRA